MKILILSSGRAGSTSLYKGLKNSINASKGYFEVFAPSYPTYIPDSGSLKKHIKKLNKTHSNRVVIEKNLVFQPTPLFPDNSIKFYCEYLNNFNKVILLVREDVNEIGKSFAYARLNETWHKKYTLNNKLPLDLVNDQINLAKQYNNIIFQIAEQTKIPITYYKNLFSGNQNYINDFLKVYDIKVDNIDILYKALNPSNRYRQL